jgi:hypothetical protein
MGWLGWRRADQSLSLSCHHKSPASWDLPGIEQRSPARDFLDVPGHDLVLPSRATICSEVNPSCQQPVLVDRTHQIIVSRVCSISRCIVVRVNTCPLSPAEGDAYPRHAGQRSQSIHVFIGGIFALAPRSGDPRRCSLAPHWLSRCIVVRVNTCPLSPAEGDAYPRHAGQRSQSIHVFIGGIFALAPRSGDPRRCSLAPHWRHPTHIGCDNAPPPRQESGVSRVWWRLHKTLRAAPAMALALLIACSRLVIL